MSGLCICMYVFLLFVVCFVADVPWRFGKHQRILPIHNRFGSDVHLLTRQRRRVVQIGLEKFRGYEREKEKKITSTCTCQSATDVFVALLFASFRLRFETNRVYSGMCSSATCKLEIWHIVLPLPSNRFWVGISRLFGLFGRSVTLQATVRILTTFRPHD